jgi:hypothetical protein
MCKDPLVDRAEVMEEKHRWEDTINIGVRK